MMEAIFYNLNNLLIQPLLKYGQFLLLSETMDKDVYLQIKLQEAIQAARGIINDSVDPVVAIRTIVSIGNAFPALHEFEAFRGWESETDEFPRGTTRLKYNSAHLQKLDEDEEAYLAQSEVNLKEACDQLIKVLSSFNIHETDRG